MTGMFKLTELEGHKQFGEYMGSSASDNRQVEVDFFAKDGLLSGYVNLAPGLSLESVTDSWLTDVHRLAASMGFEGKFRLVYSSSVAR